MYAAPPVSKPIRVFYSYSHADEEYREHLEKHLSILRNNGLISEWHDRRIGAGAEWEQEIDAHLNTAQLILLLVSPDFLASQYCYSVEMTRALERHTTGEARVVPVIIRSVLWKGAPFGKLQALPTDAKAVDRWPNRDHALEDVATGIAEAVAAIKEGRIARAVPDEPETDTAEGPVDHEQAAMSPDLEALFTSGSRVAFNLPGISQTFPALPPNEVWRENMLYAIETMFASDCKIVTVEGGQGLGKTTLLSQFARKHSLKAVTRFIRVSDPRTWDLESLKDDLAAQVADVLGIDIDGEHGSIREGDFSTLVFRLSRYAARRRQSFYLVLDGLEELARETPETVRALGQLLPVGLSGINLLLSGSLAELRPFLPSGITARSLQILPFVSQETEKYLHDVGLSAAEATAIHRHLRGIPGHLASARRSIGRGTAVEALLARVGSPSREAWNPRQRLLELEWESVATGDRRLVDVMALLAWDQRTHTIAEAGAFAGTSDAELFAILAGTGLFRARRDSGVLEFAAEDLADFARQKLPEMQKTISDRVIEQLVSEGDSHASQMYLPSYLEQAGEYEKLLKYLSPDFFARMLAQAGSLLPVKQKVALGLSSAIHLGHDGDSLRFGIQRSVLNEFSGTVIWRAEVEARIALGDYDTAVSIAQAAPVLEDRLHLLAVVARQQREKGVLPEPTLIEQMEQLCTEIRYPLDAKRAQDIAEDLIHSLPEQALELIQEAVRVGGGENAIDLAYALLSVAALEAPNESTREDALARISKKISDPVYRSISKGASLLFNERPAREIIVQLKEFEQVSHQMLVLQQWMDLSAERTDAIEAAEYALSLALGSSSYNLTLPVLKSIAAALPSAGDLAKASGIVAIVDAQIAVTSHKGSTGDYVETQLLLAQTQMRFDEAAAVNRIVDVVLLVSDLSDVGVRGGCIAQVLASLERLDADHKLEASEGLHSVAKEVYAASIEAVLSGTADHYAISKPIIKALASQRFDVARDLASRLNIAPRRDAARHLLIVTRRKNGDLARILPAVFQVVEEIESPIVRDSAISEIFRAMGSEEFATEVDLAYIESMLDLLPSIMGAEVRCRACTWAIQILAKHTEEQLQRRRKEITGLLQDAWECIDIAWSRVSTAFRIAVALSAVDQELANGYLRLADKLREQLHEDAVVDGQTYESSVRIALRAFGGLLRQSLAEQDDLQRVGQLIRRVPASGERAVLWAEMALRALNAGRDDLATEVINGHVYPAIEEIPQRDALYKAWVIARIAPALYYANHRATLELLQQLPQELRDKACLYVVNFSTSRTVFTDPFEASVSPGGELSWGDLVDLCDVLDCVQSDNYLHSCTTILATFIVPDQGRSTFTDNQRHDIANRIRRIAESKLPCRGFINHQGYVIATAASIARIEGAAKHEWERLISTSHEIPNTADKAYVLTHIAREAVERRVRHLREPLLIEAEGVADQIPAAYDRMGRFRVIGELALKINSQIARRVLRKAWDVTIENDGKDVHARQREILDLAHRIDSDFAKSLAQLADDDPVRGHNSDSVQARIQVLQAKRSLLSGQFDEDDLRELSDADFLSAIELHLAALVAGNAPTLSVSETRMQVERASRIAFGKSNIVYAWAIENAVRRPAAPAVARRYLRPMFEGAITGAEFASRLGLRTSSQGSLMKLGRDTPDVAVVFSPAQTRAAMQFLVEWVRESEENQIIIIEPEFSPDGLELVRRISIECPNIEFEILSARGHHESAPGASWEDSYRDAWSKLTEQVPPELRIILAGDAVSGLLPTSRRCIIAGDRGLSLSTSICALGYEDLRLVHMSPAEVHAADKETLPLRELKTRLPGSGQVIRYSLFSLA
jgi:hypothetical protein